MKFLYGVGVDTRYIIETQDNYVHRNRHNEVVQCRRWIGLERSDREWLASPHCSFEAAYFSSEPTVKMHLQYLLGRDSGAFNKIDAEELALTINKLSEDDDA